MSDLFPKRARLADTVEMLEELVMSQGDVIATAVQPGDLAAVATSGSYSDLIDTPQGAAVPDSTAEDVEGLVEDFNALLTSLRNAGLIASE